MDLLDRCLNDTIEVVQAAKRYLLPSIAMWCLELNKIYPLLIEHYLVKTEAMIHVCSPIFSLIDTQNDSQQQSLGQSINNFNGSYSFHSMDLSTHRSGGLYLCIWIKIYDNERRSYTNKCSFENVARRKSIGILSIADDSFIPNRRISALLRSMCDRRRISIYRTNSTSTRRFVRRY